MLITPYPTCARLNYVTLFIAPGLHLGESILLQTPSLRALVKFEPNKVRLPWLLDRVLDKSPLSLSLSLRAACRVYCALVLTCLQRSLAAAHCKTLLDWSALFSLLLYFCCPTPETGGHSLRIYHTGRHIRRTDNLSYLVTPNVRI